MIRSRTVAEDISITERNEVFLRITEALLEDLDAEMIKNIHQYLAPVLL